MMAFRLEVTICIIEKPKSSVKELLSPWAFLISHLSLV